MKIFSTFSGVAGFEQGIQRAYDRYRDSLSLRDREPSEGDGGTTPSLAGVEGAEQGTLPLRDPSSLGGQRSVGEKPNPSTDERLRDSGDHRGGSETKGELSPETADTHGENSKDDLYNRESASVVSAPELVGFSEFDKHASSVLKYRYPNVPNHGDITKIDWSTVPDFDLLVGGSPCQSFSIAGKRTGLEGKSGLFVEYVRCLQEKRPQYFIWENVKGLLSSGHGADFAYVLNAFSEAGYSLQWQICNSKDHGVAQNRERVFVIGTRSDIGDQREVFFDREDAEVRDGSDETEEEVHDVAGTQTARQYASWNGNHIKEMTQGQDQAHRVYDPSGVHRTIAANGGGLGAKMGLIPDGYRVRRLTPRECERLMSWETDWTKFGMKPDGTVYEQSDSQRYKQAGNGVVSEVIADIYTALFLTE